MPNESVTYTRADLAYMFKPEDFKGYTPLQTSALAALRAECKYPELFDAAINELCTSTVSELNREHDWVLGELSRELQLDGNVLWTTVFNEVKKLVADLNKLVADEEEALQRAERDLCARFLALIALRSHEPEDFTPERVEEDIRTLKKDRERLYEFRNCSSGLFGYKPGDRAPELDNWIRLVMDALNFARSLCVLRNPGLGEWGCPEVYEPDFRFFKELKEERDALREENEKLIENDRQIRCKLLELFGEFSDPSLSAPEALEETVRELLNTNESLTLALAEAKKRRTKRNDELLKERDELKAEVDRLRTRLSLKPAPPRPKGWRQQVAEDLDKAIEQAVVEKKRRARRAG